MAIGMLAMGQGQNQWQATGSGEQYLISAPPLYPNPPSNVTVGTTANPASALVVEGAQMTPTTGEVFRTDAPTVGNTNWRMLRGGVQYGRLFNLDNEQHFNIDALVSQMRIYTNSVLRMAINPAITYGTLGSFAGVNATGFVGICPTAALWTLPSPGPWSRLHLHDPNFGGFIFDGYRPWMINGMMITGHGDQMFVGHKYGGTNDPSDAIFAWSDNNVALQGPDHMSFRFTDNYTGAATGDHSLEGLEIMRLHPQGWVGLGDYIAGALEPIERLELMDRTIRLRNFMVPTPPGLTSYESATLENVVVVDPVDGRLYWRTLNPWGGGLCDWNLIGANNDVVTAYAGNPCPPQDAANVGIGNSGPTAKLDIAKNVASGGATEIGINVRMGTNDPLVLGGNAFVFTGTTHNVGWRGDVSNAGRNWGLDGNAATNNLGATGTWSGARVVGARGFADGNFLQTPSNIRGVWGIGINPTSGGWGFGGWFDGMVYGSLGVFSPSDLALKENVEDLSGALDKVDLIQPKSFNYMASAFPSMALDTILHFGFIAQDVEAVFPQLVRDATQPEQYDSLGNVITPSVDFKIMNTEGLVPWAFQAIKELKGVVEGQQLQIDQLVTLLSACCASNDGDNSLQNMPAGGAGNEGDRNASRLMVHPNPFTRITTIAVGLDRASQVRITLLGLNGQVHRSLELGEAPEGIFTYELSTEGIAAGQYILTVELDGEAQAAQVVKLNDQ